MTIIISKHTKQPKISNQVYYIYQVLEQQKYVLQMLQVTARVSKTTSSTNQFSFKEAF